MIEETIDEVTDVDEEMEEKIADEVEKVLFEVTKGSMGKMPTVSDKEPISAASAVKEQPEEEIDEMQKRLEALKS